MTQRYDYLIVGGGLAAASAVEGIRDHDLEGSILLLTEEGVPPYHRPPLSKEYLQSPDAGRELLHVKPEEWFESQARVTLETNQRILALDPKEMKVTSARGNVYRGERILLATGGRARSLEVPGVGLPGVYTLRTVADSEALRAAAREAGRAVLIGAGFIGMEVSASLAHYGVQSIVVEAEDRVWPMLLPPELSSFVQEQFEEQSVQFRLGSRLRAFRGDGRLEAVVLDDGSEIPCQMAVIGVGMIANDELAADAGLAARDGIVVDAYGETTHAHIYAAGDVARYPDPIFGGTARVEHWDHARAHGRRVGRNMTGARIAYDYLSYFFSTVFDLKLNMYGRPAGADRVVVRGTLGEGPSVAFCAADGRIVGAVLINAVGEMDACQALVRKRPQIDEIVDELVNPEIALDAVAG
ncbi:MAG: NAD(P)/FAD-dependent oxidoreductase [Gemmatimonadota bacterium]